VADQGDPGPRNLAGRPDPSGRRDVLRQLGRLLSAVLLSEPGGAGLGTLGLPPSRLEKLCRDAGFSRFQVYDAGDPANLYYEVRPTIAWSSQPDRCAAAADVAVTA
jgi:hypothetical protein